MSVIYVAPNDNLPRIITAVQQLAQGRSNAVGSVTLTLNSATTTVTATNCGADSTVLFSPVTAAAATEFGAGTIYVSTISNGSFVLTHVNSATAGRTFRWVCIG